MAGDALGLILRDLRPVGVSYGHCTLATPWAVLVPDEDVARLHLVVRGKAVLKVGEGEWLPLAEGDVAFIPRGRRHVIADQPGRAERPITSFPAEAIGERTYRMKAGGGGAETLMTCCAVTFDEPNVNPLIALMPDLMVVRAATHEDPTLTALLDAMAQEVQAERIGASTVLSRLADVAIVRLVRRWVETENGVIKGWLAAVRDPKLGRALATIHADPEQRWTVEDLARMAGLSRSGLHAAFARQFSMPPSRYISEWRMVIAAARLKKNGSSVGEVARRMGFASSEAFSRAFKRSIGQSPREIKRDGEMSVRVGESFSTDTEIHSGKSLAVLS